MISVVLIAFLLGLAIGGDRRKRHGSVRTLKPPNYPPPPPTPPASR